MFRENVLVKEGIIDRISATMVPIALNYEKVIDRRSRESRFVRSIITEGGDIQGVRVITADGKILGSYSGFGDMAGKTHRMIDNALKKFGPIENRGVAEGTADPNRGLGLRSDGSVCLAEYVRRRDRDKIKSPVISNVILSKDEFAQFAPSKPVVGETWVLPEAVAKRLCRAASPMCYQHAPQPDWVTGVTLKARVEGVENGLAKLAYEGQLSSERHWRGGEILSEQNLKLRGAGIYDIAGKKLQSLLLVGTGTFRWPKEHPDRVVPVESLIEWEAILESEQE